MIHKMVHRVILFTGIKRPQALQTVEGENSNLDSYEICLVEPLHDIKNVVNRLFGELPHNINNNTLREAIVKAKKDLNGQYH